MTIPTYPNFSKIDFSMKEEIEAYLPRLSDGCSEFFFSNIYFFRDYYQYQISKTAFGIIIVGESEHTPFCMIPTGNIEESILVELLERFGSLSFISESLIQNNKHLFYQAAFSLEEDRNNFDYIYLREQLASLSGKKFHKKKNHVNKFEHTYKNISVQALTEKNVSDALSILERWNTHVQSLEQATENKSEHNDNNHNDSNIEEKTDYEAAKSCLEHIELFPVTGIILYVDQVPVAWTAGEISSDGKMAVVYFEKADITYIGAFQYINYAFANFLPETVQYINREQDLGKPGLIHSKQTYHPISFIKKYCLKQVKNGAV